MNGVIIFIFCWVAGALICSTAHVLSAITKARKSGNAYNLKEIFAPLPALLILWPFSLAIYVYANLKKK